MKITPFDEAYAARTATVGTILGTADGSNSAFGGDVSGTPGDLAVIGMRRQVSIQSNITPVNVGDVLTIVQASPAQARFATPSNTGSVGSNALLKTTGGEGRVTTISASGAATTLMLGGANTFDVTLTANCTISLTGAAASGYESSVLVMLRQDGTGNRTVTWPGSVTWASGSAPTLSTTASAVDFILLETVDNGATWYGFPVGGGGTTSPLITKGDLYTYTTANARLAVGSNGTGLIADSAETAGIRWTLQAIAGELLMQDGVSSPPVPIESDPSGTDWLYSDL